jgi:hypothetical protein
MERSAKLAGKRIAILPDELAALQSFSLIQPYRAGILNVRAVLMVGMVEQDFVQAAPIKDFAAFRALREVLFFFGRRLFVFVEHHCVARICTKAEDFMSAYSLHRITARIYG